MQTIKVVEKANHLAVHAYCSTLESAQRWIKVNAKEYADKGYFMDKALTPESFEVITTDKP